MLTTLYCDASFCPQQFVGGWAIWLRSEKGRRIESGPTPIYCKTSTEAELAAVYAGVYRAVRLWPNTEAILVRSDCTTALDWMTQKYSPSQVGAQKLLNKLFEVQQAHKVHLIPRWVKGHQKSKGTEMWLNHHVDQLARGAMQIQRVYPPNQVGQSK